MGIWQTALAAIKSDAKPSAPSTDEESGNTDGSAPYMEAVMKRNQSKRDSTDPKMRIKEVLGLSLPGTPMISRGPSSNAGSKASQDAPVNPPSAGDVVGTESLLKQASSLAIQAGAEQDTTNERLPTILSFGVAAGGTESEGCRRTRGWVAHSWRVGEGGGGDISREMCLRSLACAACVATPLAPCASPCHPSAHDASTWQAQPKEL